MLKNIISGVVVISLVGCSSLFGERPTKPEFEKEEAAPAKRVSTEKKTSLYSLFFSSDEEDEPAIEPIEAPEMEVVKTSPSVDSVQQPPAMTETPVIKEAPIHQPMKTLEVPQQRIEAPKQESSMFSIFSSSSEKPVVATGSCIGNTDLPVELKRKFDAVEDKALLAQALGTSGKGKLCQGKVYQMKKNTQITLFRIWNSTNPNSQYGNWWTFRNPRGLVADYRQNNEICYQWTPMDKLSHCRLKAGTKIVIGTGQSAYCSDYLSYPTSETQQVFIENAEDNVIECSDYDAIFSWKAAIK